MLKIIKKIFLGKKSQSPVEPSEIELLRREDAEAMAERVDTDNLKIQNQDRAFERVNTPGFAGEMDAIVARTAQEHRAKNKRPI